MVCLSNPLSFVCLLHVLFDHVLVGLDLVVRVAPLEVVERLPGGAVLLEYFPLKVAKPPKVLRGLVILSQ